MGNVSFPGNAVAPDEPKGSRRIIKQIGDASDVEFCHPSSRGRLSAQRELMADILRGEGFGVVECSTAEAAEFIVTSTGVDLQPLIVDQNLGGAMKGTELAAYARSKHQHLNVVVITGDRLWPPPRDLVFLQKPLQAERLLEAVRD